MKDVVLALGGKKTDTKSNYVEEIRQYPTFSMLAVQMFSPLVALSCFILLKFTLAVDDVVTVEWLDNHKESVVLLDATYDAKPKPDYERFKEEYYRKFEKLINIETKATKDYEKEHIPGAVHFNFVAAFYPSKYIQQDLYPPEEFEKYVQMLGVNADDHLVIYARGKFGGMVPAARTWWTFKVYGHDKVSILDGGLDAWKRAGKSVTDNVTVITPGNWKAKAMNDSLLITFEELDEKAPGKKSLFEDLTKINFLDSRQQRLFTGEDLFEIPGTGATGNHLKGAKNVPLPAVIGENGIKSKEEIKEALEKVGFNSSVPTVTTCTQGLQSALLSIALRRVGVESRMYNGGMYEIALREPKMITEKTRSTA